MNKPELLKSGRDLLLKLHKTLVDHERRVYESINGTQTAAQFLNVLLEDSDFAWLRKFSTLIVEIDEMFDLKEDLTVDMINANLQKVRELVEMTEPDDYFRAKYQFALQRDPNAAGLQSELKSLLTK